MTRLYTSLAVALVAASTSSAFTPVRPMHSSTVSANSQLFYADAVNPSTKTEAGNKVAMPPSTSSEPSAATSLPDNALEKDAATAATKAPKARKPAAAGKHKTGVLSPFVVLGKRILGDEEMNKLRGKIIGEHTKVIGSFVDTANTPFGEQVLKKLFELADTDGSGTIEEEELSKALRTLGFELQDKQVKGIFERADADKNGAIDFTEFKSSAPSTLRTNLTKLAKKNGGDMGLLV